MLHGKSKGNGLCSLLGKLGGSYDKFINCSINFLCKLIIPLQVIANIKIFNLQRKLTHFPQVSAIPLI